jgi:hypothetical protein
MTSWPRLLLVPALLVAAAVALLVGAAVAQPAQEELVGGIIVVIGLLVLASVLAVLPFKAVLADRREVSERAASQTRLLEDVFSTESSVGSSDSASGERLAPSPNATAASTK